MNTTQRSFFERFSTNLHLAFLCLLFIGIIEFCVYRGMANLGFYIGVGAHGMRAVFADIGTFVMVCTGVLSILLLFFVIARLVNHHRISGIWWRGIIIFLSPMYLLTAFWSIWTLLPSWVLLVSIAGVVWTIVLISLVSAFRPISHGMKRIFILLAIMYLLAAQKWVLLDFFPLSRELKLGALSLWGYEVAQFLFLLIPVFAFFSFGIKTEKKSLSKQIHLPGVVISAIVTSIVAVLFFVIHLQVGDIQLTVADLFLLKSTGLVLSWPYSTPAFLVSVFFLCLTLISLGLPKKEWNLSVHQKEMGFGLCFIYLAGLQPFSVYLYAISLLGVALLVIGVANQYPDEPEYESFYNILNELDGKSSGDATRS